MLVSGSPATCSQADVRETVISEIRPPDVDERAAATTYAIEAISLASVDAAVSSVTCEANVTIGARDRSDRSFSIRYTIRPSVEDSRSAVVATSASAATEYAKTVADQANFPAAVDRMFNISSDTSAPDADATPVGR